MTFHPRYAILKAEVRNMTDKVKVQYIESERGWGQRVDEVKEFDTYELALEAVTEFNARNTADSAPDWYMYAEIVGLRTR